MHTNHLAVMDQNDSFVSHMQIRPDHLAMWLTVKGIRFNESSMYIYTWKMFCIDFFSVDFIVTTDGKPHRIASSQLKVKMAKLIH